MHCEENESVAQDQSIELQDQNFPVTYFVFFWPSSCSAYAPGRGDFPDWRGSCAGNVSLSSGKGQASFGGYEERIEEIRVEMNW